MRRATRRIACGSTLLVVWLVTPAPGAPPPIIGQAQLDFEHRGEPPLLMPTAVAVASDGTVYVADGVNDRVLQFTPSGEFVAAITSIGDETLSRPLGLKLDREDNLWIADTGHRRVLVRSPAGKLTNTIVVDQVSGGRAPDITDLGLAPDGHTVWLVDNDSDLLIRVRTDTGREARFGSRGDALGQFRYPFMCAVGPGGNVFVTDVINGRVIVLDEVGRPVRVIGTYGVDLGNLYRPKGVACDRDGNVWISDGSLGVVQVFSPSGAFLDVLRGADGHPLRFDMPIGLAFDAAGDLYVAELQANRVRKLRVELDVEPRRTARRFQRATIASRQPKACTACHFEWMSPLDEGRGTELVDVPPNPPQHPYVSRSEACRSCHDGSVVDSRRRVWLEHGHGTGIAPPADVSVPERLPLADGQIVCRTCHSAHTRGGSGNVFRDVVFLRVADDPAELCAACHFGFDGGTEGEMHPLGEMSVEMPSELIRHGDGAKRGAITCLICHDAHGTGEHALLVMSPASNDLCLTCHSPLTPALFDDAIRSPHGRLPVLDMEQRTVAHEVRGRLGPDGELICLTCHAAHDARTTRYLLATPALQQEACARCHPGQGSVVGTPHDLRTDFPESRNLLGVTAQAGGACSACHTAHRFARPVRTTHVDKTGRCIACHDRGELAASKRLGEVNHPDTVCSDCHEAHTARFGQFLAARPSELCRNCHQGYAALLGGPHDVSQNVASWPPEARAANDICLACHRAHGTEETGLFRVAATQGPRAPDAPCLACHTNSAPDGETEHALMHPRDAAGLHDRHGLPLATDSVVQRRITCRTCHDQHSGSSTEAALLRVAPDAPSQQLCLECHDDKVNVRMIGHDAEPLQAAGFEAGACQPCHLVHSAPQAIERRVLWPKRLGSHGDPTTPPLSMTDHYCLSCHRSGGPVEPPAIASHPDADMFNPIAPDTPGFLPLFDEAGRVDPAGSIGCRTCHLTHGRSAPALVPDRLGTLSARELRARKWHIRTFAAENVCTTCHGFDALRRYVYFHDPSRRGSPAEGGDSTTDAARGPS